MQKQLIERCLKRKMLWKDAATILQMHAKALSRLKKNYLLHGDAALLGRKPGPKSYSPPANKTEEGIEDIVCSVAITHPNEGPVSLADRLADEFSIVLNQSSVWRILKRRKVRYGRNYKRWKDTPQLYCLGTPGLELQMDACYPYGVLRRICSFDAIDDCTRYVDGKCYDGETLENAKAFVDRLVRTVPFRIQRLRIDNRYGRGLREYCQDTYGIEVITNEPYSPQQNGKIERFHKTLKREFFYRYCSFTDSLETINYKYALWLPQYNYYRRHRGLGMNGLTPAQKLSALILKETVNTLILNPQKVTGIPQQYKS